MELPLDDAQPCRWHRVAMATLSVVALAACGSRSGVSSEQLVVATVRQPATSLFFVAREAGCFDRQQLTIEERSFELGRDALALMRQGGADVAIAYETPTLRAAYEDPRIRVLTMLHTSTRNTRLVSRAERRFDGFARLRGARIALAQGSNADFFVDLALRFGGVPRSDVTVVNLSPDASVAALASGEVDAAVLSDPYAARAEHVLGDGARVLQTDLYAEFSLLLTSDDALHARRGALEKLIRALACAERVARERPNESVRSIRSKFPEVGEEDLRAQLERVRWGLGLDHILLGVLADEAEWLRASGTVKGAAPDLQRLVARRPLEDVAPEAVMLLPMQRGAR